MGGLLWWILVGLVAGFLTGKVMKGSGFGFLGDIVVGILGALAGGFLMQHIFGASPAGGLLYTILVATGGAIVLTWLFRLVTGRT